jgi:Peroxiredoxin
MSATESNMLPLGTVAPKFMLVEPLTGQIRSLDELKSGKATLVMFICNHCPFVKHVNPQLVTLAHDYMPQGVSIIAISANDVEEYPEDSPVKMAEVAQKLEYPFPYLYDETQDVARAYHAACTPDFFLFDGTMKLVYRGQLDSSRPSNAIPVDGSDLRRAIDAVLEGKKVDERQLPSIGCNIKWK